MTLLKLCRAALRFQISFLSIASMLQIPLMLVPGSMQYPFPIKGGIREWGKPCTSVPEQLGLRTNAVFPVVGVEKMELCSEQEAGVTWCG